MADDIEALRAEIAGLKRMVEQHDARIWALASFFGTLSDALSVVGKRHSDIAALRAEFMDDVQGLFQSKPDDPEEEIQRRFRSDTF